MWENALSICSEVVVYIGKCLCLEFPWVTVTHHFILHVSVKNKMGLISSFTCCEEKSHPIRRTLSFLFPFVFRDIHPNDTIWTITYRSHGGNALGEGCVQVRLNKARVQSAQSSHAGLSLPIQAEKHLDFASWALPSRIPRRVEEGRRGSQSWKRLPQKLSSSFLEWRKSSQDFKYKDNRFTFKSSFWGHLGGSVD